MGSGRKLYELDFVYSFYFEDNEPKEFCFCLDKDALDIKNIPFLKFEFKNYFIRKSHFIKTFFSALVVK